MIKKIRNGLRWKLDEFFSKGFGRYLQRIGTAISVLLNVILGGSSNQTLSARNWERKRNGQQHFVPIINFIFMNNSHCLQSWAYWRVRKDVMHEIETEKLVRRKKYNLNKDDIMRKNQE